MNNKKRVAMGYVFLLPALILFMVVVAYPVFNTLKTSFYSIRVQNIATGEYMGDIKIHPAFYGGFGYFGNCHRHGLCSDYEYWNAW